MSKTEESFKALQGAIRTLWRPDDLARLEIRTAADLLLLSSHNDVAAFAVLDGHPDVDFSRAYENFKRLYRDNSRLWDQRTLSFVACRSSERPSDDPFYASLETDPMFCRKYVIRAEESVHAQRRELLRLPFLPLPLGSETNLQRPQAAQELLMAAGVSSALARHLVEPGRRSAEGIAADLREGREELPSSLSKPSPSHLSVRPPKASSRLASLTVEGFRAYRDAQQFDLDASIVVLYGPNGLGKTSVFDAIDYACTGRIGRFSRTHRSQSEFARIATHLDKTPGTGSVGLVVKPDGKDQAPWTLQRSTGDWTTAWLDGERADRKTVLSRLTQATWLDAVPRQQTFDSLFRATHLFGQDDQELLAGFKKGSVIPEAFISEMLSLQDYSDGLTKTDAVVSALSDRIEGTKRDIHQFEQDADGLRVEQPNDELEQDAFTTPVEDAIEALRLSPERAVVLDVVDLPADANSSNYADWIAVLEARKNATDERIELVQRLRAQLGSHLQNVLERRRTEAALNTLDESIAGVTEQQRQVNERGSTGHTALRNAERKRATLVARLEAIETAADALTRKGDLEGQIAAIEMERAQHKRQLTDLDSGTAEKGTLLTEAHRALAFAENKAGIARDLFEELTQMARYVEQFQNDLAEDAALPGSSQVAQEQLRRAEEHLHALEQAAAATSQARAARETEYGRVASAGTQLAKLLNEIYAHTDSECCPLCGSAFGSRELLLEAIQQQRDLASDHVAAASLYQQARDAEAAANERVRVATEQVSSASIAVNDLLRHERAVSQRLDDFRAQLSSFAIAERPVSGLASRLAASLTLAAAESDSKAAALDESRRAVASLLLEQSAQKSQREAVQERLLALDHSARGLSQEVARLSTLIANVLPASDADEVSLEEARLQAQTSLHKVDDEIAEAKRTIRQADESNRLLVSQRQVFTDNKREVVERLESANTSMASFQEGLRFAGLLEDADADTMDALVQAESDRSRALSALSGMASIILRALVARETRLRVQQRQEELARIERSIAAANEDLQLTNKALAMCRQIEGLLKRERQGSIERHIAAYGPMVTMIQQRLRSVYGFGGVHLEAQGGEAKVQVEWRNKRVQVPPSDFFSDSQKQILMLSIFLAGGLRQNWSGFAPVLLDDPVTHFDDLNAYAFVELLRGVIATSPGDWQFVVSTCEQRLFDIMQLKFSRLESGAIFYEFRGMSATGPIVRRT